MKTLSALILVALLSLLSFTGCTTRNGGEEANGSASGYSGSSAAEKQYRMSESLSRMTRGLSI
jgi:hypothetical protein